MKYKYKGIEGLKFDIKGPDPILNLLDIIDDTNRTKNLTVLNVVKQEINKKIINLKEDEYTELTVLRLVAIKRAIESLEDIIQMDIELEKK